MRACMRWPQSLYSAEDSAGLPNGWVGGANSIRALWGAARGPSSRSVPCRPGVNGKPFLSGELGSGLPQTLVCRPMALVLPAWAVSSSHPTRHVL